MVEGQGVYYRSVDSQSVYFQRKYEQLGFRWTARPEGPYFARVSKFV